MSNKFLIENATITKLLALGGIIKNEKIWIQQNTTEVDIALELMFMGVPKQDIVIGFHTPKMRQFTDFAVR